MKHSKPVCFEELEDVGGWYAHMPGFRGLWGTGKTKEEAFEDVLSALPDWLRLEVYGPDYLQSRYAHR